MARVNGDPFTTSSNMRAQKHQTTRADTTLKTMQCLVKLWNTLKKDVTVDAKVCTSSVSAWILGEKSYEGLQSRETPLLAGQDSLFVFGRVFRRGISTFFNFWPHLGQRYGVRWAFGSHMAHLMSLFNHLPFIVDQVYCVHRSSSAQSSASWKGYYDQ